MQAQYRAIKNKYKDQILFFRLGDFYEMFFDDAIKASQILGITLTSRGAANQKAKKTTDKIPMCGIPYHAKDRYIKKIIDAGESVAICDQIGDPKLAKGIVERKVTQIITPGTYLDEDKERDNNYLMSFYENENQQAIAWLDFGVGDINYIQMSKKQDDGSRTLFDMEDGVKKETKFESILNHYAVREIVTADTLYGNLINRNKDSNRKITKIPDWYYDLDFSKDILKNHLGIKSLKGFKFADCSILIQVLGGLIKFLQETQTGDLGHLHIFNDMAEYDSMMLDERTIYNLELFENNQDRTKDRSLLSVLDKTSTPMGARLLKNLMQNPLVDKTKIEQRYDAVDLLSSSGSDLDSLVENMKKLVDFDRICSKISTKSVNPKELVALSNAVKQIPDLKKILVKIIKNYSLDISSSLLKSLTKEIKDLKDVSDKIDNSLKEDPAGDVKNGGIFRDGFNKELDELRSISTGGKDWIINLQKKEREKTKIDSLKVKYNKVFGYYIEVSKANLDQVPSEYERKQTLVNAERFITPELKEMEAKILGADERIDQLEFEMYQTLLDELQNFIHSIQDNSRQIALLDCLCSLANVAADNNYARPDITTNTDLKIVEGRHPTIEQMNLTDDFIANNLTFNNEQRLIILTGPNMSGKSTYLRQNALIILMAHIGSFVPASRATIPITDRIFTRIGASDNLSEGESTFMVEMTETANILNNATKQSFIILDEIGRGTSTYDGLAIAWAAAEYIVKNIKANTLFATHYHEIIHMEKEIKSVANYNVAVVESGKDVVFLHKIKKGGTDKSYGLEVAKLAGLPTQVIERGREKLEELEDNVI